MNASTIRNTDSFDSSSAKVETSFQELLETFSCVLLNVIAIFGIFGNVFNILILRHHGLKDSTNVILMSLSFIDLFYDILITINIIPCIISLFDGPLAITIKTFQKVGILTLIRCIGCISSTHIVLISIERLIAVFFPMKVSQLFTLKRTYVYLLISYLFWLIVMGPSFPVYSISWVVNSKFNTTVAVDSFSAYFFQHFQLLQVVGVYFVAIGRGIIFLIIISVASAATIYKLLQVHRKRSKITKSVVNYDTKAAKMLVTVSLVYLVLAIPSSIPHILIYFYTSTLVVKGEYTMAYYLAMLLIDLLYVINSSVNFIIYVTLSKKFSSTYFKLVKTNCKPTEKFTRLA